MAKVFYVGGGTHARGMLRAVVTLEQLNSLVSAETRISTVPAQRRGPDSLDEEGHAPVRSALIQLVKFIVGFVLACVLGASLAAL